VEQAQTAACLCGSAFLDGRIEGPRGTRESEAKPRRLSSTPGAERSDDASLCAL